jgi:methylmalonyl-CoA epimerase
LQLDHIAIAVRELKQAEPLYEALLGVGVEHRESIENEGVRVSFFPCAGAPIELMEPMDQKSAIWRSIEKRGEGLHHIAFAVKDLDVTLQRLKKIGLEPIDGIRQGSRHSRICFFHPRHTQGVLWELVEYATANSKKG